MKTIKKVFILTLLLISTSSCFFDGFLGIRGNGHVISEERNLQKKFNEIKVQQGIHLFLTQDNFTSLKIEADENIMDLLITEVSNNELKIYFKENVYKAKSRNVYLTTPQINSIITSSGSNVTSENTIQTKSLIIETSSGSSVSLNVKADEIQSKSSSGSFLKIEGETNLISAKASSGSSINALNLNAIDASTKASSGAQIEIFATDNFTANASSGGNIGYAGNPKSVNKNTSSGGNVSKK